MIYLKQCSILKLIIYNMVNFISDDKCNSIVEAVSYWMGYQFKIGRDKLLHEASLRYPIADTLTSKKEYSIDRVNLEKGHPLFEDKIVDLLIFDKNTNEVNKLNYKDSILEMYEFKLVKNSTGNKLGNEFQRVIDDILRLAYFNHLTKKDCYFLICGKYDEFNTYFIGNSKKPKQNTEAKYEISSSKLKSDGWNGENSVYKNVFSFKIDDPKTCFFENTNFEKENTETIIGLDSFQKRYKIKNSQFTYTKELTIKTICKAITTFETSPSRTHAVAIWKIEGLR